MSNQESSGGVTRRALLKSTALGSLALAAGGLPLPFTLRSAAAAVQQAAGDNTRIVWGACSVNCGSRCALRLHVRDDEVVYVETDNTGDDRYGDHQVRACLRGRSIRRRINHPDRLNYPMKRVGKRGEGKFERISWQEALDTLADRLKRVVAEYGNEAVYINYSSGIVGGNITRSSPSASPVTRLMNCYGGSLNQYGTYSTAQIACAMPYTYGSNDGNSTSDIENSKLVVMFGNNPAETRMSGGGITWYLEQARERSNARMIVIDPRYTDTAAGREDEWIPIRPGTDAALVAGIAWVLINENLVDQPFLDKYCVGYDEKTLPAGAPENGHYKAYILGEGDDGVAKTPQWASRITGIPADRIIKLARDIGMIKPAYICQGWGPQRQANGELSARAIAMLPILTGNVGINGGNSGARESTYTITIERLPVLENPVKTAISCFTWTDAIARGPEMTATRDGVRGKEKLDVPIKFLWNYAGNTLINQHSDINARIRTATSSPIATSAAIPKRIRSTPRPAKLRSTPAGSPRLPPAGSWRKTTSSARCRSTPPHLKAGTIRCAVSIRCSYLDSTIRRAPIPATATWMCCRPPAVRKCGSTRLTRKNAGLITAIWCGCSTSAAKSGCRRK